ncbi:MAG TPA: hypothetical protein VMY35_04460 [Phycisphaerae bacterium]|nr:hypothetical protein [Phycisphaerae bacterium]
MGFFEMARNRFVNSKVGAFKVSPLGARTASQRLYAAAIQAGVLALSPGSPYPAQWVNIGGGGPANPVLGDGAYNIGTYQTKLVACGAWTEMYTSPGSIEANRIAQWDGVSWTALGDGIGPDEPTGADVVESVYEHDGLLYAGGHFTVAGGQEGIHHIARWDGENWSSAVGGGQLAANSWNIRCMTLYNGEIILAGRKLFLPGEPTWESCIAKISGGSFAHIDSKWTDPQRYIQGALALAVYNGDLYVGGQLKDIGGAEVPEVRRGLARWDGTTWHPVDAIGNVIVQGLCVWDGKLIVSYSGLIKTWDGSDWEEIPDCPPSRGRGLLSWRGKLVTSCTAYYESSCSVWDGEAWDPDYGEGGEWDTDSVYWLSHTNGYVYQFLDWSPPPT